jgi:hypothetical protein
MDRPGDRRRFAGYAASRELAIRQVSDWSDVELVVLTTECDLVRWVHAPDWVRIVLDLPDAVLVEPRSLRTWVRGVGKWVAGPLSRPVANHTRALCELMRRADAVVCTTESMAGMLRAMCPNVHLVLDLVGEVPLGVIDQEQCSDRIEILWEGLYPTLRAVEQVVPALRDLARQRDVRLHLVTDRMAPRFMNRFFVRDVEKMVARWGISVEVHDWRLDNLVAVAARCEMAIVPVDLASPYASGKPENRLRIHWRLGLPVLASDTPAHRRAMAAAGITDDVLCRTGADWSRCLDRYASDEGVRLRHAVAGREAVLGPYSDGVMLDSWDEVLRSVELE